MKLFLGVAIAFLLVLPPAVRASAPDDEYVGIYDLIQQGDALNENGQLQAAMAKYAAAQADLRKFQAANPDWNIKVVTFRLRYLAAKIAMISSEIPAGSAFPNPPPIPPPTQPAGKAANTPEAAPAPPASDLANVIRSLQEQLRQEEADRANLQAKLKEALSAQPATVDPREFNRAQMQILALEKENDLLKVSLEQRGGGRIKADTASAEKTRQELVIARRQADSLAQANAALEAENGHLQARVKETAAPDAETEALREENAVLKKQVAELKKPSPRAADSDRRLLEAQAQIAALESDKQILRLQGIALENRVKQMLAQTPGAQTGAPQGEGGSAETIAKLETQRDALQMRLDAAMREISETKPTPSAAVRVDETSRQLDALRARIDILEAHPVPYTAEELALLSTSQGSRLVATLHRSGRKQVKELPAAAIALLTEAKRDVANQDYASAESKYREILKLDASNPAVLTDLALIEVNLNRVSDAETNITAALAVAPDNDYSLFVLGRLRLAQGKFDEALDALSRAAQINPEDAEIQNNLGVALSEKGLRGPAEAALRRAVQIDPGCADAHANLAFVYITQQPPLVELARWHYEKALAAGHPPNAAIEKLIDQATNSASPP